MTRRILPLFVIIFIILSFATSVSYATQSHYTFEVNLFKERNHLNIFNGISSKGDKILFRKEYIYINNVEYQYKITKNNPDSYDVKFIFPDGFKCTSLNASTKLTKLHGNGNTYAFASGGNGNRNAIWELLESATIVYIKISNLYRHLIIYSIGESLVLLVGYILYLKPQLFYKARRKEVKEHMFSRIRRISIIIPILGACFIYLLR